MVKIKVKYIATRSYGIFERIGKKVKMVRMVTTELS
jgi:hypothetical protein